MGGWLMRVGRRAGSGTMFRGLWRLRCLDVVVAAAVAVALVRVVFGHL